MFERLLPYWLPYKNLDRFGSFSNLASRCFSVSVGQCHSFRYFIQVIPSCREKSFIGINYGFICLNLQLSKNYLQNLSCNLQ